MKTRNKIILVLLVSFAAVNLSWLYKRPLPTPQGTECNGFVPHKVLCYVTAPQPGWPMPYAYDNGVTSGKIYPIFHPYFYGSPTTWLWLPYFLDWWFYFATFLVILIFVPSKKAKPL